MLKVLRLIFTFMLVLTAVGVNAQVTTSAISGKVTDEQSETVIGATIIAVHEPSGTQYGAITNVCRLSERSVHRYHAGIG